jgi:hypothetical protein
MMLLLVPILIDTSAITDFLVNGAGGEEVVDTKRRKWGIRHRASLCISALVLRTSGYVQGLIS